MNPKIVFRIVLILCVLFVAACKKDSAGIDSPDPVLEVTDRRVSDSNFAVTAAAASQYIEVRTNITDWVADVGNTEWITAMPVREPEIPTTGVAVVQKLKITVTDNPDKQTRSAAIKITGSGMTLTINVIQSAAGDVLAFTTPVYAAAAGETLEIPITANVEYTVSIPESCGWIGNLSAENSGVIRLGIAPNPDPKPRTADLRVAAEKEGLDKTLTVVQQGSEPAIDTDGPHEIEAAWDQPALNLSVTANVAYRVEFTPQTAWISRSAATRAVTKQETFLLTPNEGNDPRTVTINFISDDGSVSPAITRSVKLTQGVFTMPSADVFELTDDVLQNITHENQSFTIRMRTGMDADAITVAGAEGWIAAAGQPQRIKDILVYEFTAAQNNWPLKRQRTISFSGGGATIEVCVYQDTGAAGKYVEYSAVTGDVMGGAADLLYDCDLATSLMSGTGGWPKEWTLGLKNQSSNEFNRLTYYPITGFAASGMTAYELLALSAAYGTWYSVASGTVPASFYDDAELMRKGFDIDFPIVKNAKSLMLRAKGVRGGVIFGASDIHLTCDYSTNVPYTQSLEIQTPPATLGYAASTFTVGVEAAVPFRVESGADWIAYEPSSSQPGMLTFSAAANPGAQRSAAVTLTATAAGVNLSKSLTVAQQANPASLSFLSPASGSVALTHAAQNFEVDLATDIPIDEIVCGSLPAWIAFVGKHEPASGTVRFRFSADANGGGSRSCPITFSGRGRTLDLTVTQDALPDLVPYLAVVSPDPAEVSLAADPRPSSFTVVLESNMRSADITVGATPEWLAAGVPIDGTDRVTYTFTAASNYGAARNVQLTFSVAGADAVSVIVHQAAPALAGIRVSPVEAVWYDTSLNSFGASETIDGDKDSYHTATNPNNIWAYEFRFANGPRLAGFIYYPRDSASDHGTLRTITVEVSAREGGVPVQPYTVEIPQSVFADSESRRAGWAVVLPVTAELVSHLRIIPVEGWQSKYAVAEVEFYSPAE